VLGVSTSVGVPTHELALHKALALNFASIVSSGSGRSAFLITEPQLGFGRPDGIVLTMSSRALTRVTESGLRLPSLDAAKSLIGASSSLSQSHSRQLSRNLQRNGWTRSDVLRHADYVGQAVAIEAKMTDWKKAIRQAAIYRLGTGSAAILLPRRVVPLVNDENLAAHGIGLISEHENDLTWISHPRSTLVSASHRAWLVELLLRGLETRTAYRATQSRNIRTESIYP
jgi:hypothetical protein